MRKLILTTALVLLAGVTFGQTLQKGGILVVHHMTFTLDPDVTMDQFLDVFINKWITEAEKHLDGWKGFLLKGDRGENENSYAFMFYIESLEARDKYIDSEGQPNDVGNAAMVKMQPVTDELEKWGTWTSTYTDWVIL